MRWYVPSLVMNWVLSSSLPPPLSKTDPAISPTKTPEQTWVEGSGFNCWHFSRSSNKRKHGHWLDSTHTVGRYGGGIPLFRDVKLNKSAGSALPLLPRHNVTSESKKWSVWISSYMGSTRKQGDLSPVIASLPKWLLNEVCVVSMNFHRSLAVMHTAKFKFLHLWLLYVSDWSQSVSDTSSAGVATFQRENVT